MKKIVSLSLLGSMIQIVLSSPSFAMLPMIRAAAGLVAIGATTRGGLSSPIVPRFSRLAREGRAQITTDSILDASVLVSSRLSDLSYKASIDGELVAVHADITRNFDVTAIEKTGNTPLPYATGGDPTAGVQGLSDETRSGINTVDINGTLLSLLTLKRHASNFTDLLQTDPLAEKTELSKRTFDYFDGVDSGSRSLTNDPFLLENSDKLLSYAELRLEEHQHHVVYPLLLEKLKDIKTEVERLKAESNFTLENLNTLGFQVTFLFDELEKGKDKVLTNSEFARTFDHYPQKGLGEKLKSIREIDWATQNTLVPILKQSHRVYPDFTPDYSELFNPKPKESHPIHVIAGLYGVISLQDLNHAYSKRQYWIGITSKSDWTDGFWFSPLEYFHHDLTHLGNREYSIERYDRKPFDAEQKFLKYLDQRLKKREISPEEFNDIHKYLFYLMHEIYDEGEIEEGAKELKSSKNNLFHCDYMAGVGMSRIIGRFKDEHDLGILIPKDKRGKSSDEISAYVKYICTALEKEWKNCFLRIK